MSSNKKSINIYKSSLLFERTEEEKNDINKSWARSDQAFFAAGACHILAFAFIKKFPDKNFKIYYIKPIQNFSGSHVFVSDGIWAFDHNGWTKRAELIEQTKIAYQAKYSGWDFELIQIYNLESLCRDNYHRLPEQYAELPWDRAFRYIEKINQNPEQ